MTDTPTPEFTRTEQQRLLHALFPDEYDNPDGPHCQIKVTESGNRICVAGAEHERPTDD